MDGIVGWDIGGVNTKVARAVAGRVAATRARPFEIQRDPAGLAPLLQRLAAEIGAAPGDAHAVTLTAELSQLFRTKREGVGFVLDAVARAFPGAHVRVYAVDGRWLPVADARAEPLAVAAANWAATARFVARAHPDCVLVDTGSTTTDVIPIVGGAVAARGRTDPERLRAGELVYTGAVRTPAEAMGAAVALSAEGFALAGDVHLWRGRLAPEDYTAPTPDGRPATREFAGERLARLVCADRDMLDDAAIDALAHSLAEAQVATVAAAIERARQRNAGVATAVVTGLGDFIAGDAARRAGLHVTRLEADLGPAARHAPAAAVALLLGETERTEAGWSARS